MLTSIEKRLDLSVMAAVEAVVTDQFSGGVHVATLASGEVGLSPFHELDSLVPAQLKAGLAEIAAGISAGTIRTRVGL